MDLHAIHFPALYIHPLPLQTTPWNKIKFNSKQEKKREGKNKSHVCCGVTQWVTQKTFKFIYLLCVHCRESLTGLVQGLWFLLHYWFWALIRITVVYGALALWCGDPVALGLEGLVPFMILEITYVIDVGVGQHITLVPGLGSSSWSDHQLSLVLTTRVSSPAVYVCSLQWWARSGTTSPAFMPWGSELPHLHLQGTGWAPLCIAGMT